MKFKIASTPEGLEDAPWYECEGTIMIYNNNIELSRESAPGCLPACDIPDDWREMDPIVAPRSSRFTLRGGLLVLKNGIDGITYFFDCVGDSLHEHFKGKSTE